MIDLEVTYLIPIKHGEAWNSVPCHVPSKRNLERHVVVSHCSLAFAKEEKKKLRSQAPATQKNFTSNTKSAPMSCFAYRQTFLAVPMSRHMLDHGTKQEPPSSSSMITPASSSSMLPNGAAPSSAGFLFGTLQGKAPASAFAGGIVGGEERSSAQELVQIAKASKGHSNKVLFPYKLLQVLEEAERDGNTHIVSWLPHGKAFKVHKPEEFTSMIMQKYFRQSHFKSFTRQVSPAVFTINLRRMLRSCLSTRGGAQNNTGRKKLCCTNHVFLFVCTLTLFATCFKKTSSQLYHYGFGKVDSGCDRGAFHHPHFQRNNIALCQFIVRRSPRNKQNTIVPANKQQRNTPPSTAANFDGSRTTTMIKAPFQTVPVLQHRGVLNSKGVDHPLSTSIGNDSSVVFQAAAVPNSQQPVCHSGSPPTIGIMSGKEDGNHVSIGVQSPPSTDPGIPPLAGGGNITDAYNGSHNSSIVQPALTSPTIPPPFHNSSIPTKRGLSPRYQQGGQLPSFRHHTIAGGEVQQTIATPKSTMMDALVLPNSGTSEQTHDSGNSSYHQNHDVPIPRDQKRSAVFRAGQEGGDSSREDPDHVASLTHDGTVPQHHQTDDWLLKLEQRFSSDSLDNNYAGEVKGDTLSVSPNEKNFIDSLLEPRPIEQMKKKPKKEGKTGGSEQQLDPHHQDDSIWF